MKIKKTNSILLLGFSILITGSVVFAQTQSPASSANEEVEISYSEMTTQERIDMLTDLKSTQVSNGNTAAANYLQGRIDDLKN